MKTKQVNESLIETLKKTFSDYFSSFDAARLIELLSTLVGGLLVGFLFKRFGRQFFTTLIGICIIFALASYFQFITIDWTVIKSSLGISPTQGLEGTVQNLSQWVTGHLPTVIAGGAGFIIGFIVG